MTGDAGTGRLGLLGGTFDPIHAGHLQTARAAQQALDLAAVVLMPARVPPHRQQGPSASMFHRFAMAALAVDGDDRLMVSDEELGAEGPSYTALTLERLIARGRQPASLFFITGADAFAEIETWHRYPAVLELAHFVVIARPGMTADSMVARLPQLRDRMRAPADGALAESRSIFLVNAQTPDVSSTEIRRRLRAGGSISGLVPPPVERHILRHDLYADTPTTGRDQR